MDIESPIQFDVTFSYSLMYFEVKKLSFSICTLFLLLNIRFIVLNSAGPDEMHNFELHGANLCQLGLELAIDPPPPPGGILYTMIF